MLRRICAAIAVCLAALAVAPAAASAATPLPCGGFVEVTGPVTYRLTNDSCGVLFTTSTQAAVTIDLAGHTLPTIASGWNVSLSLRNGTVGFGKIGPRSLDHGTLTMSKVHVISELTADVATLNIRRSVVDGPIRCHQCHVTADHDIFRGNITFLTSFTDITASLIVGGVKLEGGEIARPDVSGRIVGNVITGSAAAGIDLGPVGYLDNFLVARNVIVGNHGDGIAAGLSPYEQPGKVTLARNVSVNNGGHGYNLTPTLGAVVVDGSRNRAAGNTLTPQCVGLTC